MALAFEVDALDGLDEPTQKLYAKTDAGKFRLQVTGVEPPEQIAGLKTKNAELLKEKKEAETKAQAAAQKAEEDARKLSEETARKKGDIDALEKSWKDKLDSSVATSAAENTRLNASLNKVLVDKEATRLAADLAIKGSANVLEPHIRNRLKVDWVDGEPVTRVLGLDGKPSALTLDELKAEFAANAAFKPIIEATKASGGGAAGAGTGGGAGSKNIKRSDFMALDPQERATKMKDGFKVID